MKPICTAEQPAPLGPMLYDGASMARWAAPDWDHPHYKDTISVTSIDFIPRTARKCDHCYGSIPLNQEDEESRAKMMSFVPKYQTRHPVTGQIKP